MAEDRESQQWGTLEEVDEFERKNNEEINSVIDNAKTELDQLYDNLLFVVCELTHEKKMEILREVRSSITEEVAKIRRKYFFHKSK